MVGEKTRNWNIHKRQKRKKENKTTVTNKKTTPRNCNVNKQQKRNKDKKTKVENKNKTKQKH